MASIFGRITNEVSAETFLGQVAGQTASLSNAAEALSQASDNPQAALTAIVNFVKDLPLPDIDQSSVIGQGFNLVGGLIPSDTSGLTGDLSSALENYFSGLDLNLTGQLGGFVQSFEAIYALLQIDFSLQEDGPDPASSSTAAAPPPPAAPPMPMMRTRGLGPVPPASTPGSEPSLLVQIQQAIQEAQGFLQVIPDPLTVPRLLEGILRMLQQAPRHLYPFQYLPVLDELRDKLETALAWEQMTGAELVDHLAESLTRVNQWLRDRLIRDRVQGTADALDQLSQQLPLTNLEADLVALTNGLQQLGQFVNQNNLSGAAGLVATLIPVRDRLLSALNQVDTLQQNGSFTETGRALNTLSDRLEQGMLQSIANLNPPSDLSIIGLLVGPVNNALGTTGFNPALTKISGFFDQFQNLLNQLNLQQVKATLQGVINGATSGVDGLRDLLIGATVNFTLLMDQVEQAIDSLGIEQIIQIMEDALNAFKQLLQDGIEAIFAPIRDFLLTTFTTLNNYIEAFDPQVVIEEVRKIIQVLTNILTDPQLLDIIDSFRGALDTVNNTLNQLHFQPVTDVVVEAIDIVRDIIKTTLALPLPDSLKSELDQAIRALPSPAELENGTDILEDRLTILLDGDPNQPTQDSLTSILNFIKVQPAKLVDKVKEYSPDKLIGDELSAPYQAFLGQMEAFSPTKLLEPVQAALEEVTTEIDQVANPRRLLEPLQAPFMEMLGFLDQIDPHALIDPLQETLSQGIHALTDNLPLEETNAVFDKIEEISLGMNEGVNLLTSLRDLFQDLQTRMGGLAAAKNQVSTLATSITAPLQNLSSIAPVQQAMGQIATTLTDLQAANLQARIETVLDQIRPPLQSLDGRNKLIALVSAHRGFPTSTLNAAPNSADKTTVTQFLSSFDPMAEGISRPLHSLANWLDSLESGQTRLTRFFTNWDAKYLGPQSPFNSLAQAGITAGELQSLLTDTIREQLTLSLEPIFELLDHFQAFFAGLLTEVDGFVGDLQAILADFLAITTALEELRDAINDLVETLENFDITFIATEVEQLFDQIRAKLLLISPERIGDIVGTTFTEILDLLNVNALLGAAELDVQFTRLIDLLRALDPGKLLIELLQPEFDKVVVFLERFDLVAPVDTFLGIIDRLQEELSTELDRTTDAYENMHGTITARTGSATASVSISS